jgi:hypothetical protein
MSRLNDFTLILSAGMEMGLSMKEKTGGSGNTPEKKSKKKAAPSKDRSGKILKAAIAYMDTYEWGVSFSLAEITEAVKSQLKGLAKSGHSQAVWKVIQDSDEIESVPNERGQYRLKAVKKAAKKAVANGATADHALN